MNYVINKQSTTKTNQTDHAPKECDICYGQFTASDRNGKNGKGRIVGHNANKGNTAIFKEYSSSKKYKNPRHWMHENCLSGWTQQHEWCPFPLQKISPKALNEEIQGSLSQSEELIAPYE